MNLVCLHDAMLQLICSERHAWPQLGCKHQHVVLLLGQVGPCSLHVLLLSHAVNRCSQPTTAAVLCGMAAQRRLAAAQAASAARPGESVKSCRRLTCKHVAQLSLCDQPVNYASLGLTQQTAAEACRNSGAVCLLPCRKLPHISTNNCTLVVASQREVEFLQYWGESGCGGYVQMWLIC